MSDARLPLPLSAAMAVLTAALLPILTVRAAQADMQAAPTPSPKVTATPKTSPAPKPSSSPRAQPSSSPTGVLPPLPSPSRSPAAQSPAPRPSPSPTPTPSRRPPSPTPVVSVIPAPSDTSAAPAAAPSPLGALDLASPGLSAGPVRSADAKPVAAASSGTSRMTRLIELLLAAAVLLGIGGAYGLWVTSEKR